VLAQGIVAKLGEDRINLISLLLTILCLRRCLPTSFRAVLVDKGAGRY
jgi:hypothetical protein